jgi:site-specific DNA recombinase
MARTPPFLDTGLGCAPVAINGETLSASNLRRLAEFPLRGFIACGDCGTPLTACYSEGRNGMHPYYLCFKRECASYRKSIRRDVLEGDLAAFIQQLQPSEDLFAMFCKMLKMGLGSPLDI